MTTEDTDESGSTYPASEELFWVVYWETNVCGRALESLRKNIDGAVGNMQNTKHFWRYFVRTRRV